jgi:SAM-dependent methyltransferase
MDSFAATFKFQISSKQEPMKNELYFLVRDMDQEEVTQQLDLCLVMQDETTFVDPFELVDELAEAKKQFDSMIKLMSPQAKEKFLEYTTSKLQPHDHSHQIDKIIEFLKSKTSISAEAPGEKLYYSNFGQFKGNTEKNTIHVDSFLYTDEDVDDLVEEGRLAISYCVDCLSKNTTPFNFISHSFSIRELKWIFQNLPNLKGKQILDIGSRLGPVLYYAYYNSEATSILGVELHPYFSNLQKEVVKKFKMGDRVNVMQADIFDQAKLFETSDVIFMHNIFEMFCDLESNRNSWNKIKKLTARKGSLIVASPAFEKSWKDLKLNHIDTKGWVRKLNANIEMDLHIYVVE